MASPRRSDAGFAAVALLAVVPFLGALGAGLVFDDLYFARFGCWQVERWSELAQVPLTPPCDYRPLRYLTMAVDRLVWGDSTVGPHLTNLLLHAATLLALFQLVRRRGASPAAAAAATVLWGVHPVHVDAVTYLSGRRDVLSALLVLLGLLSLLRPGRPRWWVAALAAALAFQAKEMAITFPLLAALLLASPGAAPPAPDPGPPSSAELAGHDLPAAAALRAALERLRPHARGLAALLALAGAGFVHRALVAPVVFSDGPRLWGGTLTSHVATALASWTRFAELVLFPWRLLGDHSDFPVAPGFADPRVAAGLLVLVLVWGGAGAAWRRRPALGLGLGWFGVAMLPVSQLVYHHELIAEHYLYLPLMGVVFPVAAGLDALGGSARARRLAWGALAAVVLVASARVVVRNRDYVDQETFARALLRHQPDARRGRLFLAQVLLTRGDLEGGRALLDPLLATPGVPLRVRAPALEHVARAHAARGELDQAEARARELLALIPEDSGGLTVLGTVLAQRGRVDEGVALLARALARAPDDAEVRVHLGVTLMLARRPADALPHLALAARRRPDLAHPQVQWGLCALELGELEVADAAFQRALVVEPRHRVALERLFLIAQLREDREAGCRWFTRLVELRPELAAMPSPCP